MARRQSRSARENSIDGVFILNDNDPQITPRREISISEIPEDARPPEDVVSGEIVNVVQHTIATINRGVDMGGRIIGSEAGSPESPTPMARPAYNLRKRKRIESPPEPPVPNRRLRFITQSPTTSTADPSGLLQSNESSGALSVNLLQLQSLQPNGPDPTLTLSDKQTVAQRLFRSFNNGENIVKAAWLLEVVSGPSQVQNALAPIRSFGELDGSGPLARMLAASRLAKSHMDVVEIHPSLMRLKTLLCYITLYLTLEYAIVPGMRASGLRQREIDTKKYRHFYALLIESPETDTPQDPPQNFSTNISFGKTIWKLVYDLGIASLPMLAVSEVGPTVIARALGPGSHERGWLISSLSGSCGWWSFAQAMGPPTLRTFFGPRDIHYKVPQLLKVVRLEPLLHLSIQQMNQYCIRNEINLDIETEFPTQSLVSVAWYLAIGEVRVPISSHPKFVVSPRERKQLDVWHWMASSSKWRTVMEFLHVHEGTNTKPTDEVLDCFFSIYNDRRIALRKAVTSTQAMKLSQYRVNPLTLQEIRDLLANEVNTQCDVFVMAAELDGSFCGLTLYLKSNKVEIRNWMWASHPGLEVRIAEVSG